MLGRIFWVVLGCLATVGCLLTADHAENAWTAGGFYFAFGFMGVATWGEIWSILKDLYKKWNNVT